MKMTRKPILALAAGSLVVQLWIATGAAAKDLRLVEAMQKRDSAAVHSLLRAHADVNAAQSGGATALSWAVHWGDVKTAELLIRAGANVNAANDYAVTPLSLACTSSDHPMVDALLKA